MLQKEQQLCMHALVILHVIMLCVATNQGAGPGQANRAKKKYL